MITIREVKTLKQKRQFVNFPNLLYKNNEFYVPALWADEMAMFSPKKNPNYNECDSVFYLAYDENGNIVGRINGIIHHVYNKKTNTLRARFGRFDFINDEKVACALLNAVEEWARNKDMEIISGPLGYNDLQREGLLIEGFDNIATLGTAYNYSYYRPLIEKCGYQKEVDTVEFKIFMPENKIDQVERVALKSQEKYNLRVVQCKSVRKILKQYSHKIFKLLDQAYSPLYGVVPINKALQKQLMASFTTIIKPNYICVVVNENDDVVGFGLVLPNIAKPLQLSKGKILTRHIFKLLHTINHPDSVEMALIAVDNNYRTKGATAIVMNDLLEKLKEKNIKYAESNPQLETNYRIQSIWKGFKKVQHKRRRYFIKALKDGVDIEHIRYKGEFIAEDVDIK